MNNDVKNLKIRILGWGGSVLFSIAGILVWAWMSSVSEGIAANAEDIDELERGLARVEAQYDALHERLDRFEDRTIRGLDDIRDLIIENTPSRAVQIEVQE